MSAMTIEITQGRYFAKIWFLGSDDGADFLAALYRDAPVAGQPSPFKLTYRFRYHADDGHPHPFDPANTDRKSWYLAVAEPYVTEDELVETTEKMIATLIKTGFGPASAYSYAVMRSDDAEMNIKALQGSKIPMFSKELPVAGRAT